MANSHSVQPGKLWQGVAVGLCIAFGLSHLLNVFTAGDGLWYWYAVLFDRGERLYAGLHLNLQPLFILLTRASLHLFGTGWLGFRVFPLIQVVLYSYGLYLIAQFSALRDGQRALLIVTAFGVTLSIFYYRFDDFHVTTQIFQVYALWLLLRFQQHPTGRRALQYAVPLGALAGLSISNRLNDGAALLLAGAVALCGIALERRLASLLIFCGSALAAFSLILLLTGDTVHNWYMFAVVQAANIKGGSGHILLNPLVLPFRMTAEIGADPIKLLVLFYPACIAACIAAAPIVFGRWRGAKRILLLTGLALAVILAVRLYRRSVFQNIWTPMMQKLGVPLACVLLVYIAACIVRAMRRPGSAHWNSRTLLLLVPVMQLFLAAVTGGGGVVETTPALALTLLLLPVVFPDRLTGFIQNGFVVLLLLFSFPVYREKVRFPFLWHHFYSDAMFQDRVWYRHPVYGPMYIGKKHLNFILPICAELSQQPGTLLSLPYSHANYFCNVPPWHGYVQTWYDTSSRETIGTLIAELESSPPTWIFYERSSSTLHAHEVVYNNGRALPQRALDELIVNRISGRRWQVKRRDSFGGADWLLIRTSPLQPGEPPPPVLQALP